MNTPDRFRTGTLPSPMSLADSLQSILTPPLPKLAKPLLADPRLRLVRLAEINEEKPSAYRSALANVYAALDDEAQAQFLYLLDGGPEGVALYFGVIERPDTRDGHEALKNLRGALEGQLPGIHLARVDDSRPILERLRQSHHRGLVLGVPTAQEEGGESEEEDFQGIERLVRTLMAGSGRDGLNAARWQLAVVCEPLSRAVARERLDAAYDLASAIAAQVRTSVQASSNTSEQKGATYSTSLAAGSNDSRADTRGKSEGASNTQNRGSSSSSGTSSDSSSTNTGTSQTKNWGTNESVTNTTGTSRTSTESDSFNLSRTGGDSVGVTQELTDKRCQHLLDHLEKGLIPRLQKGVTKGLFATAIHLCADTPSSYQRLRNTVRATYQGGAATASPLEVLDLPDASTGQLLQLPTLAEALDSRTALYHSLIDRPAGRFASLLTTDELALVAGLPRRELPGLRRRKTVDFSVDLLPVAADNALDLGEIVDRGRRQPSNRVRLNKADLDKHIFITGVTGAGKTTTCLNLLLESGLPFLVIEPAKTEYRALHAHLPGEIDYYRPNGDTHRSLRLNPFALLHKAQKVKSHASFLRNVFAAVFPMEASMPYLVEQAILRAYEEKGWDLAEDTCLATDDAFDPATRAWPTMSDMIRQLDILIPEQGMGRDFEEKYRGSLVSRLGSLSQGVLGDILDVPQSLDFAALLGRRAVIELEEIKDGEGKALIMALLLGSVSEAIRSHHHREPGFRHLTLVEEAHRLLAKPEPGDKARAFAVEAFADLLAEVRNYGEGLIIADQIPAKLIPDVIKNTHTKIVHRLFAEDDRRAMGEAMMMDDGQRDFLPNLATGEAIVFCGGWHGPAHAAIRADRAQTGRPALGDDRIEERAIAQLWRERARYYPLLCRLEWLAQGSDAQADFARFVRESRTALNNLLALIQLSQNKGRPHLAPHQFRGLQRWLTAWQPRAIDQPAAAPAWQTLTTTPPPGQPLTAPLLALMLDANPRAHAQAKNAPAWSKPVAEFDWTLWRAAIDALLEHLATAVDAQEFTTRLLSPANRDLKAALQQLGNYQSF